MARRGGPSGSRIPQDELPSLVLPVQPQDHCLGPPGARFSLVEYGDYECPHCAQVHPIVQELRRDLEDEFSFAFRHFPRPDVHPRAVPAAEAAEAADLQAKFWLMHDRLFEHQADLSGAVVRRLARELPLDMATYERDLGSGAPARHVAADREGGIALGVVETPTFFVNGRMYTGPNDLDSLLEALRGRA